MNLKTADTPDGFVVRKIMPTQETAYRRHADGTTAISSSSHGPWIITQEEHVPNDVLLEFFKGTQTYIVARYDSLASAQASPTENAQVFGPYETTSRTAALQHFMRDPDAQASCPPHGLFLTIILDQADLQTITDNPDGALRLLGTKLAAEIARHADAQRASQGE